jgi:hypothetical protein
LTSAYGRLASVYLSAMADPGNRYQAPLVVYSVENSVLAYDNAPDLAALKFHGPLGAGVGSEVANRLVNATEELLIRGASLQCGEISAGGRGNDQPVRAGHLLEVQLLTNLVVWGPLIRFG